MGEDRDSSAVIPSPDSASYVAAVPKPRGGNELGLHICL